MQTRFIHSVSQYTIAFVWMWHGLVPKLLMQHPDEYTPLLAMGIDQSTADIIVAASGYGEIAFGLLIIVLGKARWPYYLTIIGMSGLLLGVFFTSPELTLEAFNPVTLNILMIMMAVIAILSSHRSSQTDTSSIHS